MPDGTRALCTDSKTITDRQPAGALEKKLRSGGRLLLVEMRPPDGPDLRTLDRCAERLGDVVDGFQLTDMPFATPHVANLAAGARLRQCGHEVVLNLSCRDRNVIAQQGTLLGAAALGIPNVFCIRGDTPRAGDHPTSVGVFETSGTELIALAKRLRETSAFQSGRSFRPAPALFIGAAIAPHARYGGGTAELVRQKVTAGADFLTTQPVFDPDTVSRLLEQHESHLGTCFVLAGIGPVTTLEALTALRTASEVHFPDELADELRSASPSRRADIGMRRALQVVESALAAGARGVLVFPFDSEIEHTREFAREVRSLIDRTPG